MGHFLQGYIPIFFDFRQVYRGILSRFLHHAVDLMRIKKLVCWRTLMNVNCTNDCKHSYSLL
jgi:hypothetical protein